MNRKITPGLALWAMLILAACSPAATPTARNVLTASSAAPVALTLWHTQTGAAKTQLDALIADFQTAYPTLTVRAESKATEGDLLRQGVAGIAMNQTPDLVLADPRTIAEFARKGALVNLDTFLNDPGVGLNADERGDFFPGVLDSGRVPDLKNQQLGFPFDKRLIVLFYNADLLRAAKVSAPPRTWDEFGEAARATTHGATRGWAMLPSAAVFSAFVASRGGTVLSDTQKEARLDDEPGLKALQLITGLTKSGATYLVEDTAHAHADFAQGKTALWFGASGELPLLVDALTRAGAKFQWGVTNVPQNDPRQPVTVCGGADWAIFRTPPDRQRAAWLFVRWLTAAEQGARWSRATLAIPLRASALNLLAANPPPLLQRLREGFGDAIPAARALPVSNNAAQMDSVIVEMWLSVANGADPATALRNASTRLNRLLGPIP